MGWIENNIEEQIRPEVKLLRDNGFNTECSCHHEMYVQCQLLIDGELMRLHTLLFNNGYRNYTIEWVLKVMNGHSYPSMMITFNDKQKVDDEIYGYMGHSVFSKNLPSYNMLCLENNKHPQFPFELWGYKRFEIHNDEELQDAIVANEVEGERRRNARV